jgi:quercetin dioxygenase-like cupin family protein/predicted nucleic acid-binding Zn ribbon protein
MTTGTDVTVVDSMQTVRVTLEEEFSDRRPDRASPFKTERLAFNIYDFEPWQALPMRRHPQSDSVLLVIQGEGKMFIDDDSFSLEPGEAVYVPAGARYGILARENDMVIIATQGPAPVEIEDGRGLEYECPACSLKTPASASVADGTEAVCPRCEALLRLRKEADRLSAEEIGPPVFAGPAPGTVEPGRQRAGEAALPEEGASMPDEGAEMLEREMEVAVEASVGGDAEPESEDTVQTALMAFSAYNFEPWQVLPMHLNPGSDTILYIAGGQGIMYIDDEEQSVDAGVAVYVPAGATYGLLAGDYDLVAVAVQCPVPVESKAFENLGYNCPVCDLGTPVTTNTFSGCVTVCPRCNVKLKLTKLDEGFDAEETAEPAPASAETI